MVEFDPTFPPEPGVSNKGGWRFCKRTAEDDADRIIRVNEYTTNLTDDDRLIWRLPEDDGADAIAKWSSYSARYT